MSSERPGAAITAAPSASFASPRALPGAGREPATSDVMAGDDFTEVECSCGAKTILFYDRRMPSRDGKGYGRYVPRAKWWKFRGMDEGWQTGLGLGWYCGESGHFQKVDKEKLEVLNREPTHFYFYK